MPEKLAQFYVDQIFPQKDMGKAGASLCPPGSSLQLVKRIQCPVALRTHACVCGCAHRYSRRGE